MIVGEWFDKLKFEEKAVSAICFGGLVGAVVGIFSVMTSKNVTPLEFGIFVGVTFFLVVFLIAAFQYIFTRRSF